MDQEPLDEFEQQLGRSRSTGAPAALRREILSDIEHELRAARWDRRLLRTAALLLVVGVGFNAIIAFPDAAQRGAGRGQVASNPSPELLVDMAIVVAEATDAETGRQYARQLAASSGRVLTDQETAAIDAAANGGRG